MNTKTSSLAAAFFTAILTVSAQTENPANSDNLEVLGQLTLRSDAYLEGAVWLGKLPLSQQPGLKIEVKQAVETVEVEDVTPGHYENRSVWVDVYGEVPAVVGQTYIEEYGHTLQSQWVDEYGPIVQEVWVDDYGTISEQVWVEERGMVEQQNWVPDAFDNEGNLVAAGHYETVMVEGVTGGHYEARETFGITGGHMETITTTGIIGGGWQDVWVWGVVGGHYEDVMGSTYGVVGSQETTQEVWVPESRSSRTETRAGVPMVRFVGQELNSVWSWKNQNKELMELSSAGLSLPKPYETDGRNRAVLTSTEFEQSFTADDESTGAYVSYGVKLAKDGIETWNDEGSQNGVTTSRSASYKPQEVIFRKSEPSGDGISIESRSTRIAATDAEFGGNVAVKGILRVNPAGDVGMGDFTNGPKP